MTCVQKHLSLYTNMYRAIVIWSNESLLWHVVSEASNSAFPTCLGAHFFCLRSFPVLRSVAYAKIIVLKILVLTFYMVVLQIILVPCSLRWNVFPQLSTLGNVVMGNRQGDTKQMRNLKLQLKTGVFSNTWSTLVLAQCPEDRTSENDRRCLSWKSFHFAFYRFIEEKSSFEYGQVNHALAAAMRTLIKEYMILITQLEHLQRQGLLSLQKLWFYIQPTMRTLEILASLGKFQKHSHYILTGAW